MELAEEKIKVFNSVIRDFHIAIKNSVFYSPDHPISSYSINNFKAALYEWFSVWDTLTLGITQDDLFLDGEPLEKKEQYYSEVANYLHLRGLSAIIFLSGVTNDDLMQLFNLIRQDRKTIIEQGGIIKNLASVEHIQIKELDYSNLLVKGETGRSESEEDRVWRFLADIAQETKQGELPESKAEFLIDFFADAKKSATLLNKVYKEAMDKFNDEETAEQIRDSVTQICEYFDDHAKTTEEVKDLKVKLMNVISQLHPDLISTLFDQTVGGEEQYDLAEAITKDFSESYIAEFIESLISNEDTFNENLLKLFDKLAPNAEKNDNMVMMVADKLFSKRVLNPNQLSELQMSIMEIFKRHPESSFMNQIYKITVDAVINKKIDTLVYVAKLSPMVNKFVQSLEEEELKKEKIWLLLNILWLENSATEFKKYTDKILTIMPELLDCRDIGRLKDVVEFYADKTRPEQRNDPSMAREIREGLIKITSQETIDTLIMLIPEASKSDLEDIAYILFKSGSDSSKKLLDAFLDEKVPSHRNRYMYIFSRMKRKIAREVVDRLSYCEAGQVKELFYVLYRCAADKAHFMAKKLLSHKSPQVRSIALDVFAPRTAEERDDILSLYVHEKSSILKMKAAAVLIKTRHRETIDTLFKQIFKKWFHRKKLIQLVELCGRTRVQETYWNLKKVFEKKPLIASKRSDDLRIAALSSIARLGTEESTALVQYSMRDRSRNVRQMSEILLELDE